MASQFSSLLRGINRNKDFKLNILCINNSEYLQNILSNTGHNFYFLQTNQNRIWDNKVYPIPENCIYLNGDTIDKQLSIELCFDLIIVQDKNSQYNILSQISRQMACPIICIDEDLPNIQYDQFYIRNLSNQIYDFNVFSSNFVAESWGFSPEDENLKVIHKSSFINNIENRYNYNNKIFIMSDYYNPHNEQCGFEIYSDLKNSFDIHVFGQGSNQIKSKDHRLELYKHYSIFLNTNSWKSFSYEALEAMSNGCVVISLNTSDVSEYIINEKNGFLVNNVNEFKIIIDRILKNKEELCTIGNNAKKHMEKQFNAKYVCNQYNDIFYKCINKPCKLITGI